MVAGIQELLLLIIIVLAIVLLPRMTATGKGKPRPKSVRTLSLPVYTGRQRLAIVMTLIWPAAAALYFVPWQNGWKPFLVVGLGPLVLGWSAVWVVAGFKGRKKR